MAMSRIKTFDKDASIHILSNKPIIKALRLFVFPSLGWEKTLTNARRDICLRLAYQDFKINNELQEFIISLSMQCFLNEYIYSYSDQEYLALGIIISRCLKNEKNELIWILQHPSIFTVGKRYNENCCPGKWKIKSKY